MSLPVLTEREFDTIDAFHTLDGGEHSLPALANRMGVSYGCMERRIGRMRKRGLVVSRREPSSERGFDPVLVRVSELGEFLFARAYDAMLAAS